jgi:pimeloyl-ACP methyl ester carboxylesterase
MDIESFPVSHHETRTNGIRMHYVEKGTGPLVVMLHGFPEHWWSWRHQIEPVADAGYRVVAPDLRGYNDTERRGPYDLDTRCADVRGLIEALGERRATVVGHVWGGAIAWHFAATQAAHCERLVVLNGPHPAVYIRSLVGRGSQLRRSWYIALFQVPWLPEWLLTRHDANVVERMIRASSSEPRRMPRDEIRPFRDAIQEPGAAHAMLAYYRTSVRRGLAAPRASARYAKIAAPTRVIWGMRDVALGFEEQVTPLARYVEHLEVARIEDAGHFVQSERPDAVNAELIDFLKTRAVPV